METVMTNNHRTTPVTMIKHLLILPRKVINQIGILLINNYRCHCRCREW